MKLATHTVGDSENKKVKRLYK